MRPGNIVFTFDRIAEAEAFRADTECKATIDLASAGQIEPGIQLGEGFDHRGGRVRLHRVIDERGRQQTTQRGKVLLHRLKIDDHTGRRWRVKREKLVDPLQCGISAWHFSITCVEEQIRWRSRGSGQFGGKV